jgi:hypothetical protein
MEKEKKDKSGRESTQSGRVLPHSTAASRPRSAGSGAERCPPTPRGTVRLDAPLTLGPGPALLPALGGSLEETAPALPVEDVTCSLLPWGPLPGSSAQKSLHTDMPHRSQGSWGQETLSAPKYPFYR